MSKYWVWRSRRKSVLESQIHLTQPSRSCRIAALDPSTHRPIGRRIGSYPFCDLSRQFQCVRNTCTWTSDVFYLFLFCVVRTKFTKIDWWLSTWLGEICKPRAAKRWNYDRIIFVNWNLNPNMKIHHTTHNYIDWVNNTMRKPNGILIRSISNRVWQW